MSATPPDDRPWWSSGSESAAAGQDPIEAHRAARRADDRGGEDPSRQGDRHEPPIPWAELASFLTRLAGNAFGHRSATGDGPAASPEGDQPSATVDGPAASPEGDQVCHACPFCAVLRAVEASRPEVIGHLGEATRRLTLAVKTVLDAQVAAHEDADRPSPKVRRIDLDPDERGD